MSVFHQLKNLFQNNSKYSPSLSSEQRKAKKYETVADIVRKDSIKKSQLPSYAGLEKYELISKLGEGAFSTVYKALEEQTSRHVAIKVVRKLELSQAQKSSVLKETQIMRTLNHSSIVKLLHFLETKEHYFLVLELCDGGEIFHQIVRLTYFSEDLSRHCIKQVAEAIRYLHQDKGVVHRDIKPENILFESIPFMERKHSPLPTQPEDDDEPKEDEGEFVAGLGGGGIGKVKIADFGLSKVVWDQQTMTPCGTVGYTAPEIVRDERYSKSVDMWALGCVLYTMLCGFPPFFDESIATLTQKVAQGEYTFLSPWWDHISVGAKDVVSRLLDINPKNRLTIDQFLNHPWMSMQDIPRVNSEDPLRKSTPDLLVPPSTTTSLATENISITSSSPKNIPQSKRRDCFSSGVASMKEVFDVSYAVHRMGEERAQRKEIKKHHQINTNNTNARQSQLRALAASRDDDDENSSDSDTSSSLDSSDADANDSLGVAVMKLKNRFKNDPSGAELFRRDMQQKRQEKQTGKINRTDVKTVVAPGDVRRKPFELNLDNATLIERRRKSTPSGRELID